MNMDLKLEVSDVIPLINRCWAKSFSRKDRNQKAIAHRGWYLLNYNLLTDSKIIQTKLPTIDLTIDTDSLSTASYNSNKLNNPIGSKINSSKKISN